MFRYLLIYVFVLLVIPEVKSQTSVFNDTIPYGNILDENLIISVYNRDYPKALQFINKGAKVNTRDYSGFTPLIYAIEKKDVKIVELLLSYGADANQKPTNYRNAPPLIMAAKLGYTDIASLLLKYKADVTVSDYIGASALHYAALYNDTIMAHLLLNYEVNTNEITLEGETPLLLAAYNGSNQVFDILLNNLAKVELNDNKGYTPLMAAAQNGHYYIALKLIENWADINWQNKRGFSALSLAIANGYGDIAELLILNGANVNEQNTLSLNPLGIAKSFNKKTISDSLKGWEAKPNYLPYFVGFSPEIAILFNDKDMLAGISIAKTDLKYNFELAAHYYFRPTAIPVFKKTGENTYFQYWERRHRVGLSLSKSFSFYTGNYQSAGGFIGTSFDMHFGNYRGTTMSINQGLYPSPYVGFYYKSNELVTKLSCNYTNYKTNGLTNWYVGFSVMYRLFAKPEKINKYLNITE